MKAAFVPRLINGPFGDPGLYVAQRWHGTAVQFDLGRLDRLPAAEVLKLTHVFVSHTHIDHFIGFDRLVRLFLARHAEVSLFGPQGFVRNVMGKLAGYTWNLVEGYPFVLNVYEVSPESVHRVRLPATTAFGLEDLGSKPFTGVLHEDASVQVRATHLDHRTPCLGFALFEKTHLNVRKEELDRLGIPPGPWLNQLKAAIRDGRPADTVLTAKWRAAGIEQRHDFRLGELRERLVLETRGQKIAYVVDSLFSAANARRIVELAHQADLFYCEAPFLDADREQAMRRYHLTARQAGTLARWAEVQHLEVFHFSPRYEGMADRLAGEAAAVLTGALAPDDPV